MIILTPTKRGFVLRKHKYIKNKKTGVNHPVSCEGTKGMGKMIYLLSREEFTDDNEFKNKFIIEETATPVNENGGIKDTYLSPEEEVLSFEKFIRLHDN